MNTPVHTGSHTVCSLHTLLQLSISRKMGSTGSSSLDDIFLASSASDSDLTCGENKRRSAYTEAFIDAITAPQATKAKFNPQRRVSAPGPPVIAVNPVNKNGSGLENVSERGEPAHGQYNPVTFESTMPMSYSADDLQQLQYDAEKVGPSKWKKFGIAAGYVNIYQCSVQYICICFIVQDLFVYIIIITTPY